MWASFKMPVQSTEQITMGSPAPRRTKPMASSSSSQSANGLIQPPQSGWPTGGVTSKRKGAMRRLEGSAADEWEARGSAATAVAAKAEDWRKWRRVSMGIEGTGERGQRTGNGALKLE